MEQLGNFQLRIHDQVVIYVVCSFEQNVSSFEIDMKAISWKTMLQMILLEGAKATTETVDALRTGAQAMKNIHKLTYAYLTA